MISKGTARKKKTSGGKKKVARKGNKQDRREKHESRNSSTNMRMIELNPLTNIHIHDNVQQY